jgi:hypothetical protein
MVEKAVNPHRNESVLERFAKLNFALGAVAIAGALLAEKAGMIGANVAGPVIAFGGFQFVEAAIEKYLASFKSRHDDQAHAV